MQPLTQNATVQTGKLRDRVFVRPLAQLFQLGQVAHANTLQLFAFVRRKTGILKRRALRHFHRNGVFLDHRAGDCGEADLDHAGTGFIRPRRAQPHLTVAVHFHENGQIDAEILQGEGQRAVHRFQTQIILRFVQLGGDRLEEIFDRCGGAHVASSAVSRASTGTRWAEMIMR